MSSVSVSRSRRAAIIRRELTGWLFVAPWIVGFVVFQAYPFLFTLRVSFFKVPADFSEFQWLGTANYARALFGDATVAQAFITTFRDTAINVPIIMVFSLLMALLLHQSLPGRLVFRSIFFLPVIISTALVIRQLAQQNVGILSLTRDIDVEGYLLIYLSPALANQVVLVFNNLVLVLWQSGIQIILFLAGLHSIPPNIYEAARVDGTTAWESFWIITLPLLSPIVLVTFLYTLVDSFTDPFNLVMTEIQTEGFQSYNFGYAAAIAWLYFVVVFVVVAIAVRWLSGFVFYAGERSK